MFRTVCDDWSITGDYHEYAFGSKFDSEGNMWVVLCLTGSFNSNAPYRGWCVRDIRETILHVDHRGNRSH